MNISHSHAGASAVARPLGAVTATFALSIGTAALLTGSTPLSGPDLLWPGAGLAVGWSCRWPRQTPMVLLGLAAAFVVIAIGIPGVAAPVTATAAIAAWLQTALVIVVIRRLSLCPAQSPTEWMALLLIVAVAAVGWGGLTAALGPPVPLWWGAWVSGSLWGVATFVPLALTVARPTLSPARRVAEYLLITAATVAAMVALFWLVTPGRPGLLGWPYLVIVGLVWLAVRFGVQGLAPVLTLLGCSGLMATVVGRGAFAAGAATIEGRALVFEVFLIVIGTAALLLALITDQRHCLGRGLLRTTPAGAGHRGS